MPYMKTFRTTITVTSAEQNDGEQISLGYNARIFFISHIIILGNFRGYCALCRGHHTVSTNHTTWGQTHLTYVDAAANAEETFLFPYSVPIDIPDGKLTFGGNCGGAGITHYYRVLILYNNKGSDQ